MEDLLLEFARLAPNMVWAAVATAVTMAAAVVLERTEFGVQQALDRRRLRRYRPLVHRALEGDDTARDELLHAPTRHRIAVAWLVIEPLITDRDPARIVKARAVVQAMSLFPIADRYLRSRLWWRRARALRALGLIQATDHTPQLVDALDDPHPDVRAAALDGLTDMHDDGLEGGQVVHVRQPVERGGPHVRVRVVERGDELRGMVRGLDQPECAQGARPPPPQPAPQITVGDREQ